MPINQLKNHCSIIFFIGWFVHGISTAGTFVIVTQLIVFLDFVHVITSFALIVFLMSSLADVFTSDWSWISVQQFYIYFGNINTSVDSILWYQHCTDRLACVWASVSFKKKYF